MPSKMTALPLPSHYDRANSRSWNYAPNLNAFAPGNLIAGAEDWRRVHGIKPAGADRKKVHLLIIDAQKDFCFPDGSLYVRGQSGTGAMDDNAKTAEFIYRNLGVLTDITTTLDSHMQRQIFFPSWWLGRDDKPVNPFRFITTDEIRKSDVRPNPAMASWLAGNNYPLVMKQSSYYTEALERAKKYMLYVWPYHCMLGGNAHALAGVIQEAQQFHAFVRGTKAWSEVKGTNPWSECFSVLGEEVRTFFDGSPLASKNEAFIKTLFSADIVIIVGQARTHCVKSTIDDLLIEMKAQPNAKELLNKVYVGTDAMSDVLVPDEKTPGKFLDIFTADTDKTFANFAAEGMHLVSLADPIESWPGVNL